MIYVHVIGKAAAAGKANRILSNYLVDVQIDSDCVNFSDGKTLFQILIYFSHFIIMLLLSCSAIMALIQLMCFFFELLQTCIV